MFKKIFIALAALLILPSLILSFFDAKSPSRMLANFFTPKAIYDYSPSQVEKRLKKIEKTLPEIKELIIQSKPSDARNLFDRAFFELNQTKAYSGNAPLSGGRTLNGELLRLEADIGQTVQTEFSKQLEDLAKGGQDTTAIYQLIRFFPNPGGKSLNEVLLARSAVIDLKRRIFAARWIRIQYQAGDEALGKIVLDHLRRTTVLPPGFTLAYGPPLGPAEEAATFATIALKLEPEIVRYDVFKTYQSSDGRIDSLATGESAGLINRVTVTVSIQHAFEGYATSWDSITKNISNVNISNVLERRKILEWTFEIPAPAKFEFPSGQSPMLALKERNAERVQEMQGKLAAAIKKAPPLDFVPARNSKPPALSRQAALLDEQEFVRAASASLAAKKSAGLITCIAVELMIEPLAESIESQLDQLTVVERSQLIRALAARPWFHGFNTLAKLMPPAPADGVPPILEAMKRDLNETALMTPALTRMLQEKNPHEQGRMVGLLVSYSPASTLPDLIQLYPNLGSVSQSAFLTSMMRRDRPLAGQLAQQLIESNKSAVVLQVTAAMAHALSTIYNGRKMTLFPEEIAVFTRAVTVTSGEQREQIIKKMPCCEELLAQFLRSDRTSWTEAETLELYDRCTEGPVPYNYLREAEIMGLVFKSVKAGRLNDSRLAARAHAVLSSIANNLLRTRGDEQTKIPLLLQVIDERSLAASEICPQSIQSMVQSLEVRGVLAHPDARNFLIKAKAYGTEPNWAKFMSPPTLQMYGKDFPGERFRTKIYELITEAAKTDPSYRELL